MFSSLWGLKPTNGSGALFSCWISYLSFSGCDANWHIGIESNKLYCYMYWVTFCGIYIIPPFLSQFSRSLLRSSIKTAIRVISVSHGTGDTIIRENKRIEREEMQWCIFHKTWLNVTVFIVCLTLYSYVSISITATKWRVTNSTIKQCTCALLITIHTCYL